MPLKIGSLFSGIDGLALGVQFRTMGRVAWHAEIDPDGSRVLASHWQAPNLGDLTKIDWSKVPRVDIMVGGPPCQDVSLAGKGAGIDGPKSGLWREYVRAIRALRPDFVFVENVSALLSRGFERVASDLASCGYRFAWSSYSSGAVGAPHRRERIFILAVADTNGERLRHQSWQESGRTSGLVHNGEDASNANGERGNGSSGICDEAGWPVPANGGSASADSAGERRKGKGKQQRKRPVDAQIGANDANADRIGFDRLPPIDSAARGDNGASGHDIDGRGANGPIGFAMGHDTGAIPGGVPKVGKHGRTRTTATRHLNPAFVEWMMGFPPDWTAMVPRRARLRLLGNAVQPQVAMAAWDGLMARLEKGNP